MLNLLNLNVEVDSDQLFSEICDLNKVWSFINGEHEPSVSGPRHSEKKESDQDHSIYNNTVNFLSDAKHILCPKFFNIN